MKKNLLFIVCFLAAIGINYTTTFAQITLPYQQKFNLQNFPPFWTQTSTISPRWSISQTSNAGGTPNEMMASGTAGIGVSRLIVGPINTAGLTSLNLQFQNKYFYGAQGGYSIWVQSSLDGATWTNEGFALNENSYNCANIINMKINNNVGATTYIAWSIIGDHSNFESWFIDDIIIGGNTQNDAGINSLDILSPRDACSSLFPPKVTVINNSSIIQSFPVQLTISDGYISTKMVSDLNPGSLYRVTFDLWNLIPGVYTVTACTQLPGDQNVLNDCKEKQVIILNGIPRFQQSVDILDNWNIVSIPGLIPIDQHVNTWWTGRDQQASVYKFDGNYQAVTFLEPGIAYWVKHLGNRTYNTGDEWPAEGLVPVPHLPFLANGGWNLIGGFERSFPADRIFTFPPDLLSSPIYKFSGGYHATDTLTPGTGYWVKTTSAGQIYIDSSCVLNPPLDKNKVNERNEFINKNWGRIILSDAAGQNYTLFASNNQVDAVRYELPPPPPPGVFDIRYSSGKIAEDLSSSQSIEINGVVYPVKIKVENMHVKISDIFNSEIDRELKPGEELRIHNNQINKLIVQSSSFNVPVAYSLDQNYPNPFNPATKISWQAPVDGHQTLIVFDVLGNEVAVLVDEFRPAGRYEATFEAGNLASGIYLYKLQAGDFIQTNKMILMK